MIPEFDNPGHIRSVGTYSNFRDYVTCVDHFFGVKHPAGLDIRIKWGPPTGDLDPTLKESYEIMTNIITEL